MDILKLQTDSTREDAGVAVSFGDATVTIRSRQSEAYKKVMRELFKPHESSIQLGVLPEAKIRELMNEGAARGLIVDWNGFEEDGQAVPFTTEKAKFYLDNVSVFRNFVEENADKIDNFRAVKEESEVKNS